MDNGCSSNRVHVQTREKTSITFEAVVIEIDKADQNSNLPLEDIYPGGYESKPVNTLSSTTSTGVTLEGISIFFL